MSEWDWLNTPERRSRGGLLELLREFPTPEGVVQALAEAWQRLGEDERVFVAEAMHGGPAAADPDDELADAAMAVLDAEDWGA